MEFPHLGEHCTERTCNRLDFLPMKCDACAGIFCTDHVFYAKHSCPSAYKKDVQVPVCPLCNTPVSWKRGAPPDLAVSLHMDNDCRSDYGESRRKVFANKCSLKGCKVKELVRVDCGECGLNFCLKHRHTTDHACVGRDEATRRKRLEAIDRQTRSRNDVASAFGSIQGSLGEDEALARALQESLRDQERTQRRELQPVPPGGRDRCRLS